MLFPRISMTLSRFLTPVTKGKTNSQGESLPNITNSSVNVVEQIAAIDKAFDESAQNRQRTKNRGPSQNQVISDKQTVASEDPALAAENSITAGHATRLLLDAYRILREQQVVAKVGVGLKVYLSGPKQDQKTKKLSKGIIINENAK